MASPKGGGWEKKKKGGGNEYFLTGIGGVNLKMSKKVY